MSLPASGIISLDQVNVELGRSATATISLNETSVRGLFGVASGAIDMNIGHNKSNGINLIISANTQNYNVSSYTSGGSLIVLTINPGVSVNGNGAAAITVSGLLAGSSIKIINNGSIFGHGGAGGAGGAGSAGGDAINSNIQTTIDNTNGSIFGGGGGGGAGDWTGYWSAGGGGGQGIIGGAGGPTWADTVKLFYNHVANTALPGGGGGAGTGGRCYNNFSAPDVCHSIGGTGGGWGAAGGPGTFTDVAGAGQLGTNYLGGPGGYSIRSNGTGLSIIGGNNANQIKGSYN